MIIQTITQMTTQEQIHNLINSIDSIDEAGQEKAVKELLKFKDKPDGYESLARELIALYTDIWNQRRKRIVFSKPK